MRKSLACAAVLAVLGAVRLGSGRLKLHAQAGVEAPSAILPPHVRGGGISFQFDRAAGTFLPPRPPETPVSLTASDGTGLQLTKLHARAVIRGPIAFTELRLSFQNPRDRVIEGRFRMVLPQGASVSRFAMKQEERWQEGEVVELQKARQAYEDFLHRRQDPALLEKGPANEFAARVFPIPPRGVKELILSYSQELARSDVPYTLALRGLPEVGELDVAAASGGKRVGELKRSRFVPDRDFEAGLSQENGPASGLRHEDLVVARVRPVVRAQPDEVPSLLLLFDTSASRGLGFKEQVRLLGILIAGLARGAGSQTPVTIACFDQEVEAVYEGGAGAFTEEHLRRIRSRRALGASDLNKALVWARDALKKRPAKRVILMTDGVATAGAAEPEELAAAARGLKAVGVERLDAVAVGGIRDEAVLRKLVASGLPRDGTVADGDKDPSEIGRKLTGATQSNLAVSVAGASWHWPPRLDGVQAGDEVVIYARLPASRPLRVMLGGADVPVSVANVQAEDRPLLERAAANASIARLLNRHSEADGKEAKARIREEIVQLSVQKRVLSPYTALLVLETEEDFARYGLDRNALSDILIVEGTQVRNTKRGGRDLVFVPRLPTAGDVGALKSASMRGRRADSAPESLPTEEQHIAAMEAPSLDAEPVPRESPRPSRPPPSPSRHSQPRFLPGPSPVAPPPGGPEARGEPAYTGTFMRIMDHIAAGRTSKAEEAARAWLGESPGDVMALVGLGEVLESAGRRDDAARAYGSIIDLFPDRADLRRFAGARLERLKGAALELALDSFKKALENRPDHPSSHRLYAFALIKRARYKEAFEAIAAALSRRFPNNRFRGVDRILREDLGLAAAAWIKAEPTREGEILELLKKAGGTREGDPSIRFVLNWETDANDVDFHIRDAKGGHAYYSSPQLNSGGELYADVTTGYGPECFTIRLPKERRAAPYKLQAHYYSRGPMGFGMGKLQVIEHDGRGGLVFEDRPFVVMNDKAFVELGTVR